MPFVPEDAEGGFADILFSYLAFDLTPGSEFVYLDCAPPDGQSDAGTWVLPGGVILHVNRLVFAYNYDPTNPPEGAPLLPPGFMIGGQGYSLYGQAQIEFPENSLFGSPGLLVNATFFLSPDETFNLVFNVPDSVTLPGMDTRLENGNVRMVFFEDENSYSAILHGRFIFRDSLSLSLDHSDDNTVRIIVDEEGLLSASGIVHMQMPNMAQMGLKFDYDRNGSPGLQSLGNISLGNGIVLHQREMRSLSPILFLDSSVNGIHFGISAVLDIPGDQGTQKINVSGEMTIENGVITSAVAESGTMPNLTLPNGLPASDVNVRLVYANQNFGVEMSGNLDFGSGETLYFSGNLQYNSANPQDISFDMTLDPAVEIRPFGNDITIAASRFSLSLDTIPLKGSAQIEGDLFLTDTHKIAVSGEITESSVEFAMNGAVVFPSFEAGGFSGKLTLNSLEVEFTAGAVPPLRVTGRGSFRYTNENQ
ncbi:MAG TPA: hypothetical protein PLB62_15840, partial [Candidatus Sumerlaeota bacterium]|nr:hypothetical protein [Candidatus Sumerlaeota bacterium]